jgi:hypothetical protein
VRISTPSEIRDLEGNALAIVPPGQSSIEVLEGGRVFRISSTLAQDLSERAVNAAAYTEPHPFVAALEPWPEPADGFKIRTYSLEVPRERGRFGRIWRSTNLMINWTEGSRGPRDPTKLSPHSHADFEQGSLVIEGEFVHHLRWPWTTNLNHWREDDHRRIGSPSLTIIPPTTIHTSQAIGEGTNLLIDVFSPPRFDFSEKPGWVLNHADYPMPTSSSRQEAPVLV